MPHLEFYRDHRLLFVHLLKPGRTVVGRSDRSDVSLPSEQVSRVHCIIDRKTDGWWIADRSTHGTSVNGQPTKRHHLQHSDVLEIGEYRVRFIMNLEQTDDDSKILVRRQMATQTTAKMPRSNTHEEIVDISDQAVTFQHGALRFVRGAHKGKTILLKRSRTLLGGEKADFCLHTELPNAACVLRMVRGRVMVEPGSLPSFLLGQRIREITPVKHGEEISIGEHGFVIEVQTQNLVLEKPAFGEMIGQSTAIRQVFGILYRMAAHDHNVLLTGESGTGKELSAKAIHEASPRAAGQFVPINCAGIPEHLFESELFGHEKGAFTGADKRQDGAFHHADGGTLFLDEVGELPLNAQAKLLRVLGLGEVRRVGSNTASTPDVRVISATNRNLAAMVQNGTFRSDLFFRLTVLTVRLPPLRERKGDIPKIAQAILSQLHPECLLTVDAADVLETYHWPGNIRELRNVLTRAFVLSGPSIRAENLTFNPWSFNEDAQGEQRTARYNSKHQEREAILMALRQHGGNKAKSARSLNMPRSTLIYKMKKLQIHD